MKKKSGFFNNEKHRALKEKEKASGPSKHTIMVVDDEEHLVHEMQGLLGDTYHTIPTYSGQEALKKIDEMEHPDEIALIISDQRMPMMSGIQLFEKVKKMIPDTMRILLTAFDEKPIIKDSVNKAGVDEFILKSIKPNALALRVKKAIETFEARCIQTKEYHSVRESFFADSLKNPLAFENIVTVNAKMLTIFKYIESIAPFNTPVLITGETGTGKELIARVIHRLYCAEKQLDAPFVADNVAGWDQHLFKDTLFGHKKGAFTGADTDRKGLLKMADKGTLFLDEIGDLPLPLQINLLRLLQEKKYFPLGVDKEQTTTARFVFATHGDLNKMKEEGTFRKDLFYRLNTHHIHLPPLRERIDDIGRLVNYFVEKAARKFDKKEVPTIPGNLIHLLSHYHFPGNIRELEGMVNEAVSLHREGSLAPDIFETKIKEQEGEINYAPSPFSAVAFGPGPLPVFDDMVKQYCDEAYKRSGKNQVKAAEITDLERSTFVRYWKGELKKCKSNKTENRKKDQPGNIMETND